MRKSEVNYSHKILAKISQRKMAKKRQKPHKPRQYTFTIHEVYMDVQY